MKTTRRGFLAGACASMGAIGATATDSIAADGGDLASGARSGGPSCLDYGTSFVCNSAPFNAVRFWIESRTTIIDDAAGVSTEFYQCASCKSENTFAHKDLFHKGPKPVAA